MDLILERSTTATTEDSQRAAPHIGIVAGLKEVHVDLSLQDLPASYTAVKRLGHGAQAQVFSALAAGDSDRPPCALKVFEEGISDEVFERELAVIQKLSSSNCANFLRVHGFLKKGAKVQIPRSLPRDELDTLAHWRKGNDVLHRQSVISAELCQRGDLFDLISKAGRLADHKQLKFAFLQIAQAVHTLHEFAGYAHLDLKLENVLIGDDGALKLCDFGMACPLAEPVAKRFGTDGYMAPEVDSFARGTSSPFCGRKADVFSLGVTLFILYFGAPPFRAGLMRDRNYSLLQRRPEAFWRL